MPKRRRFGRRRAVGSLVVVTTLAVVPICLTFLMASSSARGPGAIFDLDLAGLGIERVSDLVAQRDAQGRWLFGRPLLNSIWVAMAVTLVGVTLALAAAFALSRSWLVGRRKAMAALVSALALPPLIALVPLYALVAHLGLVATAAAGFLVYLLVALPLCVWGIKSAFDVIPTDIEEAALIDGAGWWRAFTAVLMPLMWPPVVATGLFSFLTAFNGFVLAATFIAGDADWGAFGAAFLLASLPVCTLFALVQPRFVTELSRAMA